MKTKFIYIYIFDIFLVTWLYPNSSFKIFTACFSEKPDTYKYIVKGLSVLSLLITCTQIYILLSHYIYNLFIYLFIYYLFFNSFFHLFLSSKYKQKHELAYLPLSEILFHSLRAAPLWQMIPEFGTGLKRIKILRSSTLYSEFGNIHWLRGFFFLLNGITNFNNSRIIFFLLKNTH